MSAASEARDAAVTLRLVLEKVTAGELVARPSMVRRLEGALLALEVLSRPAAQRRQR